MKPKQSVTTGYPILKFNNDILNLIIIQYTYSLSHTHTHINILLTYQLAAKGLHKTNL